MKVLPLNPLFPIKVLNSLCKVVKIIFHKYKSRDWISQKGMGRIKIPINVLIQLRENEKILVEGSNTEKRFIIIFKKEKFLKVFFFQMFLD